MQIYLDDKIYYHILILPHIKQKTERELLKETTEAGGLSPQANPNSCIYITYDHITSNICQIVSKSVEGTVVAQHTW